jgi:hypothetical protein
MSAPGASVLRRGLGLLLEPRPTPPDAGRCAPAVAVVGLSRGCGATTVARGLGLELGGRARVQEAVMPAPDRVVVAVADGRGEPVLAALVTEMLTARHARVLLVANRPHEPGEWSRKGALCVPASWIGAVLVARGHRPAGAMRAAVRRLAQAVIEPCR